jgi:esterase/lipase
MMNINDYNAQIADYTNYYENLLNQRQQDFQAQMQAQQLEYDKMVKNLQAQYRNQMQQQQQSQQTAQVLGPGGAMVIRPKAPNRFGRPELQIKSMNVGI